MVTVKLKNIIDGMDFQIDEMTSYLNINTGEVLTLTEEEIREAEDDSPVEDFPEWQQCSIIEAQKVLSTNDYITLPSKFDIHEYSIIENFVLSYPNHHISGRLYDAIKGKGAFSRFRSLIDELHIKEEWFSYREKSFRDIAISWCEDNNIDYQD